MKKLILVASILVVSGCATITPEAKNELAVASAIGQGNVRDWDKLTPTEQKGAYWKLTRALLSIRKGVTGEEIPAEFLK